MAYYVTSNDFGDDIATFLDLAGGPGSRVGAVVSAIDDRPVDVRAGAVDALLGQLRDIGLEPVEFDLRTWFDRDDTASALDGIDALWVRGGNTFLLRAAIARSGLEPALVDAICSDRITWGGASAGGIVLGPSLHGVELMNDPSVVERTYGIAPIWSGLGVLDEIIVPHFRSGHVESDAAEAMFDTFTHDGTPFRTLRSGESIHSR